MKRGGETEGKTMLKKFGGSFPLSCEKDHSQDDILKKLLFKLTQGVGTTCTNKLPSTYVLNVRNFTFVENRGKKNLRLCPRAGSQVLHSYVFSGASSVLNSHS